MQPGIIIHSVSLLQSIHYKYQYQPHIMHGIQKYLVCVTMVMANTIIYPACIATTRGKASFRGNLKALFTNQHFPLKHSDWLSDSGAKVSCSLATSLHEPPSCMGHGPRPSGPM